MAAGRIHHPVSEHRVAGGVSDPTMDAFLTVGTHLGLGHDDLDGERLEKKSLSNLHLG